MDKGKMNRVTIGITVMILLAVFLFLGYPLDDVAGFIEQKGKNYKCCGIWKVYGDEHKSRMTFQKLKKCSEIYQRLFADGRSILQLTVAA